MDKTEKPNITSTVKEPEAPKITRIIDGTTYEISVHFSKTNKESMNDKMMRLILNDCANL